MTIYIDEPLKVPIWPTKELMTEQEVIEEFPLKDYMRLEVISEVFEAGEKEIAIQSYNLIHYSSQFIKI